MKAIKSASISDDEVRVLLDRYKVPSAIPRGSDAVPREYRVPSDVSVTHRNSQGTVGCELPPFDDINAANELIGALVMGLWNKLTRHQERSAPFRLLRFDVP
jgi:hypothetical protein